jgi:hypothetical protein
VGYDLHRKEKDVLTACLKTLKLYENARVVSFFMRMNSGIIPMASKDGKVRKIRMCRSGTADIYVRLNNGQTLWVEAKRPGETQRPDQIIFQKRMEAIGDVYMVVESVHDLMLVLKSV